MPVKSTTYRNHLLVDLRPLQGPDAKRGIGTYARGLIDGFAELGVAAEVDLLVERGRPEPSLPARFGGFHNVRRRYHGRLWLHAETILLARDLARIRAPLYHAIAPVVPRRSPVPVVVTLHDLIPWALGGAALAGERLRQRPLLSQLRHADLVLAVSAATSVDAIRIARIPDDRIRVVAPAPRAAFRPVPEAAERISARWRQTRPYLLYVGALDFRKDPAGLLRAWDEGRRRQPDLDLLLAGDPGPQAPPEMGAARKLAYVSEEELAELYSAAVALVFPSRYEGFGLPVLEALACGCPVVAYRNSSLPEAGGTAAVLVETGDAGALGRAAAAMLDPGRRRDVAAAGVEWASRFSWRDTAQRTYSAYQSLLR